MEKELEIEKRWLQRVRIDSREFIRFYDKYVDRIFSYILVRTSNVDVAMDLTNETFTYALDNLGGFHWKGYTLGAWLFRIAQVLVRKHTREAGRLELIDERVEETLAVDAEDKLDDIVKTEGQRFLMKCLETLDETSRSIFALHYWTGLTVREISVIIGIKEGTIQSRLKRDREKIRRMYGADRIDFGI